MVRRRFLCESLSSVIIASVFVVTEMVDSGARIGLTGFAPASRPIHCYAASVHTFGWNSRVFLRAVLQTFNRFPHSSRDADWANINRLAPRMVLPPHLTRDRGCLHSPFRNCNAPTLSFSGGANIGFLRSDAPKALAALTALDHIQIIAFGHWCRFRCF